MLSTYRSAMLLFLLALLAAGPTLAQAVPPKKEGTTRVALLGCLRQFEPSPGLYRYIEAQPDLCLWLGDNIYADTQDDPDVIRRCYAAVAARPEFQWLCDNVPYAVTWDDHDYGDNNVYKDYPLKEESREIYLDFWKLRDKVPAARPGIYYAEVFEFNGHRLHVVMTDTRWNRDDPGPESDMLGEDQWAWLEDQLATEADLHVIVSGSQFLLTRESGSETWDQYPKAMQRFTDLLRRSRAERVVFVTGDQHYAEVARKRNALDFDFVELEFCGINQIEDPEYNPLRVSTVASSVHSCAFIDIQWEGDKYDVPHLLFSVYNALDMQAEILYRVNLDELALDFGHEAPHEFVEEAPVEIHSGHPNLALRYTTDGSVPTPESPRYEGPFAVRDTTTVRYALFDPDGWARSDAKEVTVRRVEPIPAASPGPLAKGLRVQCYEGAFERVPDFDTLDPVRDGVAHDFDVAALGTREDGFALRFEGYLRVPRAGMYQFVLKSDDGSRLMLHDTVVVDNDGSHSARVRRGRIALAAGLHPVRLEYFEDYMGQELSLRWSGPGVPDEPVPQDALGHAAE